MPDGLVFTITIAILALSFLLIVGQDENEW